MNYAERKAFLESRSKEWLEASILDQEYNSFLGKYADYDEDEYDPRGHGKRLPYIGWYWRSVQFSVPTLIPIGHCGDFIGFMENNKWDYPSRYLTEEEAMKLIQIIDEAKAIWEGGGNLAEMIAGRNAKLDEIWEFMQSLKI